MALSIEAHRAALAALAKAATFAVTTTTFAVAFSFAIPAILLSIPAIVAAHPLAIATIVAVALAMVLMVTAPATPTPSPVAAIVRPTPVIHAALAISTAFAISTALALDRWRCHHAHIGKLFGKPLGGVAAVTSGRAHTRAHRASVKRHLTAGSRRSASRHATPTEVHAATALIRARRTLITLHHRVHAAIDHRVGASTQGHRVRRAGRTAQRRRCANLSTTYWQR
mmetsp:Transcript_18423/g.37262  ORF Transcript_18423/g.37262 Transcript_18423/m.37262 type:complete len:226 (-) Transcript_18423:283-960(-)